jgi:CubicO group peptidase (beta-lactamase class C family)
MTRRLQTLRGAEHGGTRCLLGKRARGATFTLCAVLIGWPSPAADREDALHNRIARIENGLVPSSTAGATPATPWNIQERMQYYHVPGVSIAIIHNYTLEWAKGFGVLEAGGSTPVNSETLFQAASISKPVTAMGILSLAQEGRLKLDGEANQFLSTWRIPDNQFTAQQKVIVGHLLTHTAGTTAFGYAGYSVEQPLPTLAQVLDGQRPPANSPAIRIERVPGTEHVYSNGGYVVLQQMAVDVTGMPFGAWIQSTVLDKVEMTRSTFAQPLPRELESNASRGHLSSGSMIRGGWMVHPEQAAAGLWSTASDLARLASRKRRTLPRPVQLRSDIP